MEPESNKTERLCQFSPVDNRYALCLAATTVSPLAVVVVATFLWAFSRRGAGAARTGVGHPFDYVPLLRKHYDVPRSVLPQVRALSQVPWGPGAV